MLDGLVLAQAADLPFLQRPQQLGLQRQGQVGDLVQEKRAAVGRFQQADAVLGGAAECPLSVAEQFRFQQRVRDGRGIDRNERLAGPGAEQMDGAGHQFLAAAAFAGDQQGKIHLADLGDHPFHFPDLFRCADDEIQLFVDAVFILQKILEQEREFLEGFPVALEKILEIQDRRP